MYIADLHIHSRYSRATSREGVPEYLDLWARRKGIDLVGTGDFTHPAWRQELAEKLTPGEEGLYVLKDEFRLAHPTAGGRQPRFVVSGEISSIYKKNGKTRKVHNVILLPGLEEAQRLSRKLETIGNIHSDGRPILGLDCRDLLEITLDICPRAIFVPAHIWTPHFSMFGAFSGFDTVEECFEDLAPHIRAIETGLSSDPPMNWRLSALDGFQMISNSDAHSPAKLGREASLLEIPMCYDGLYQAVQEGRGLEGTIEFFPEEGKYHYDGHRKCHLCLSPREAEKYGGKCPACGRKLTLGVSHRIEQMSDREEGYVRKDARPFESLVPLPEVIAASTGRSAAGAYVQRQYEAMLKALGTEFSILRDMPIEDIKKTAGHMIGEGVRRLRAREVERFPGFDGEYGSIKLFEPSELEEMDGQMNMFALAGWPDRGGARKPYEAQEAAAACGVMGSGEAAAALDALGSGAETASWGAFGSGKAAAALGAMGSRAEAAACGALGSQENAAAGVSGETGVAETGRRPVERKESLNSRQLLAVNSVAPRIAVVAGPGTGKTKTLASRIRYLLQTRRVKPSEITAVTFTRKAAQEMKSRLKGQLGRSQALRRLQIGTFHSICYDLLKKAGEDFLLADRMTTLELAQEAVLEAGLKEKPERLLKILSERKTGILAEGWGEASGLEEGLSAGDTPACQSDKLEWALRLYQEKLGQMKALDFDDLLLKALELARQAGDAPDGRKGGESQAFRYLLVDEFQDTSPLQYRLIQEWSRHSREVFIIGDSNQAIYGFRGADSESFQRFMEEGETQEVRLEKNYRSTPEILAASQEMIAKGIPPCPLEPTLAHGAMVRVVEAEHERGEAIFVAKEINRLIGGIDMLDAHERFSCPDGAKPRSFSEIAVLYRTHRQAQLLEKCLATEGIPYVVAGREDFLWELSVRGSIGFFRSILNPEDILSQKLCRRLLGSLAQGEISQSRYESLAETYGKLCKRTLPQKVLAQWREEMGLANDSAMEKLSQTAIFHKTMAEFLESLAFGKESDIRRCGGKTYTSDAVTLMTLHGSKGLEFPVVMLYGIKKGIVPLEQGGKCADAQEERRLLYVGMTRAMEELIVTTSGEASPFLAGLPGQAVLWEKARQKKKDSDGMEQLRFEFL